MTSDEIAALFYKQGLANKWLSKKQASWLYNQACFEAKRQLTTHGAPTAHGTFLLESGEMIGWEIAISPKNGCAPFKTHSVTELHNKAMVEEAELRERGKEFCKTIYGTPYAEIHPPELIARMFRVSIASVQEWMKEIEAMEEQTNGEYVCKECGKPVEQAIEGELRCQDCYDRSQMSREEWKENQEMIYWATHCNEEGCGKVLKTREERGSLFCREHRAVE